MSLLNLKQAKVQKLIASVENGDVTKVMVVEDVEVFDNHFGAIITTDLYVVNDAQGFPTVIAADSTNQLFEVYTSTKGDRAGKIVMNNSNGFGTINYSDNTVSGWNFDREPNCTTPEGFTSSGQYLAEVA